MSLLDFLSGDNAQLGLNLLAAGGPTTDPNATGIGSRLAGAVNATRASRDANDDRAMRRTLLQSQIDENASQNAARRAQLERQTRMDNYYLGGGAGSGGQSASMPEGSALKAAIGAPANAPRPPQGKFAEWSQQFGIPVDALVADYMSNGGKGIADMLMKRGTPDMQVANGYAYDKNRLGAGYLPSLTVTPSGQVTQISIDSRGQPIASAPQGSADLFRQNQRTTQEEASRFAEGSPTIDPVTGQKVVRSRLDMFGGAPAGGPAIGRGPTNAAEAGMAASVAQPNPDPVQAAMRERAALVRELPNASDPQSQAAMRYQIGELDKVIASGGAGIQTATPGALIGGAGPAAGGGRGAVNPAPAMPAPAIGPAANVVELSPAQQTANEAARTRAVESAKGEVAKEQDKQKALNAGNDMLQIIDKALKHPGRTTATGLSGTLDPRNYVPGTQARNFQVVRDQLRGQTFLQAFTALKGGGAITETEGAKAEGALGRLDRAQSDDEFENALNDLKSVVTRGLKVARGEKVPDEPLPTAGGAMPAGWTVKAK